MVNNYGIPFCWPVLCSAEPFQVAGLCKQHITATRAAEETNPDRTLSFPAIPTGNFSATGSISSLLVSKNRTAVAQYVFPGNWNVLASNGNITYWSQLYNGVSVNRSNRLQAGKEKAEDMESKPY